MKKLLFISLFTIIACKKDDIKLTQIEKNIQENAMGNEIGYQKGIMKDEKAFTAAEILKTHNLQTGEKYNNIEDAISDYEKYESEFKKREDVENYWIAKGRLDLFKSIRNAKTDDVVLKVYKYDYKIDNLMDKKTKVDVSNYYFFNPKDSLLASVDYTEIKDFKKELIKVPDYSYILALTKHYAQP